MSDKSKEGKTDSSEGYSDSRLADFMHMQKPQPKTPTQNPLKIHPSTTHYT